MNPGLWGVGDKLTSAQQNALDANTSYALDKRSGETDTLESVVTLDGTITVGAAGKVLTSTAGSVIEASGSGKIELKGSATLEQTSGTSAIKIYKALTYNPVPDVKIWMPLQPRVQPAGWSIGNDGWMTADANGDNVQFSLQHIPDGALLSYGTFQVVMAGAHAGVPGTQPRVRVVRYDPVNNASVVIGTSTLAAGSTATYEATTQIVADCTASAYRTVDKSQYEYAVEIRAESGANALTGSVWRGVQIWFTLPTLGGY